MAQLEANREIIAHYAGLARKAEFRGMVAIVSDPVDNLAAAFLDASGLEPWQIQGYGLGVMNKRAEYHAAKLASEGNGKAALYMSEGRAFGPHGKDLVIANSIEHYDDDVSRLLTDLTVDSNVRVRELGFKPYIAPAMSSAAISMETGTMDPYISVQERKVPSSESKTGLPGEDSNMKTCHCRNRCMREYSMLIRACVV